MDVNDSGRRLRCVKCDALQPMNGKLLACLHIICATCAADSINGESNGLACCFCGDITEPPVRSVPLLQQLLSCELSLYNAADTEARLTAGAGSGQRRRQMCEMCDEGSEGEATHWCERCRGALLCAEHVESHSRRRLFAGHVVQPLTGDTLYPGKLPDLALREDSDRCFFHGDKDLIAFCVTCGHGVCAVCISRGLHNRHTSESLQSVADKERSEVIKMTTSKSSFVSRFSEVPLKTISSLMEAASQEMAEITAEASIASAVVTVTFDRIESALQEKRQELLQEIEKLHWKQLQVVESRQQRLYRLEETHTTLEQLKKSLMGGEMKNMDVIRVARLIKKHHTKMKSDWLSVQAPQHRSSVTARPSSEAIDEVEAEILAMMKVYEAVKFNVRDILVTFPDSIYICEEFSARITLPIPSSTTAPEISARYISPSIQASKAPVTRSFKSSGTKTVLLAQIKPMEIGRYTLQIRDNADKEKIVSFGFTSAKSPGVLDPLRCSSNITLSNNNMTATCIGTSGIVRASVVAQDGHTTGVHSWKVRLSGGYNLAFGVAVLPNSLTYDQHDYFCGVDCYYGWCSHGFCLAKPVGRRMDNCKQLQHNEMLTLTLNCEQATLDVYIHGTHKQHTITGLKCLRPLYLALSMNPGHVAEFF